MYTKEISFLNPDGFELSASLDLPLQSRPNAYAVFAHVFTGSKDLSASRNISRSLTQNGIAVLRFDFTGLGSSAGEFKETTFSSNVDDIVAAADLLEEQFEAPQILVGHSLGGAAAIFAAARLSSVKAVAVIGSPCQPEHVTNLLEDSLEDIEREGKATVSIAGRKFTIKREFLEDLRDRRMDSVLGQLDKSLLIMHSPQDRVVEIENAAHIYKIARHPKSFITLDGADHLLTEQSDAHYAGDVIASWATRYLQKAEQPKLKTKHRVVARLEKEAGFTTEILADEHSLIADEPKEVGGNDFGPSPYELLMASLGACTAMTLQMYAKRKKWDLQSVKVHLNYSKDYFEDCKGCEDEGAKLDTFERVLEFSGDLDEKQRNRLVEIAEKCPVHKTLMTETRSVTVLG